MLDSVILALPPPLAPGDLIAVVAPSGPPPRDELWSGLAWLRARYRIRMGSGVLARDGYLAGDDGRRIAELAGALLDGDVKAVVAARGGYGALRMLDDTPWDALARKPKWVVGFSDVTALHAMAWRAGVASVHGPNVTGLGNGTSVDARAAWLAALERPSSGRAWSALRVLHRGPLRAEVSGPLVGGNLSLVHSLAAAGRLTFPEGAVLALEDVGEAPYRIESDADVPSPRRAPRARLRHRVRRLPSMPPRTRRAHGGRGPPRAHSSPGHPRPGRRPIWPR